MFEAVAAAVAAAGVGYYLRVNSIDWRTVVGNEVFGEVFLEIFGLIDKDSKGEFTLEFISVFSPFCLSENYGLGKFVGTCSTFLYTIYCLCVSFKLLSYLVPIRLILTGWVLWLLSACFCILCIILPLSPLGLKSSLSSPPPLFCINYLLTLSMMPLTRF